MERAPTSRAQRRPAEERPPSRYACLPRNRQSPVFGRVRGGAREPTGSSVSRPLVAGHFERQPRQQRPLGWDADDRHCLVNCGGCQLWRRVLYEADVEPSRSHLGGLQPRPLSGAFRTSAHRYHHTVRHRDEALCNLIGPALRPGLGTPPHPGGTPRDGKQTRWLKPVACRGDARSSRFAGR